MDAKAIKALLERFPAKPLATGGIRTCPVRLSYPQLFKPQTMTQDDGSTTSKYSAVLLFPKGADLALLHKAAAEAAKERFGARKVNMPFRDQGERVLDDGTMPNGYVDGATMLNVNANTEYKPGVVLRDGSLASPSDIYPGVWALVSLNVYAYDNPKRKGVSFGLRNVMKLMDDERLAGGSASADKDFEPVNIDDIEALYGAVPAEASAHDFG